MTFEQERLLLKATRSVAAARLLLEHENPDFATSRAYYAMFYLAEALLKGRGMDFASHGAVISALGREFVKTGQLPQRLHQYLHRAYEARTEGDYHVLEDMKAEVAATQIERAAEFLEFVQNLLANPE